jgi:hypothetical protein
LGERYILKIDKQSAFYYFSSLRTGLMIAASWRAQARRRLKKLDKPVMPT